MCQIQFLKFNNFHHLGFTLLKFLWDYRELSQEDEILRQNFNPINSVALI